MIFEDGYGPRIACESEWGPKSGEPEWDFDKLRGVKADIKVMIYECQSDDLEGKFKSYLADCALIGPDEAFLFVKFN